MQAASGLNTAGRPDPPRIEISAYKIREIVAARQPLLAENVQSDPEISDPEWARRERIQSFVGYPLIVDGRLVGVLTVFDRAPFSGHTRRVLEALAGLVGQAIVRKRVELQRSQLVYELENERARLAAVIENLPVGVAFAEAPSGRILMGNPRLEAIVRHPILPTPDLESYVKWGVHYPDGRRVPAEEHVLARAVKGETTQGEELVYHRGDGTRGWVRVSGAPIRDREGKIVAGVIAVTDIDVEKQAEQTLRTSNAELEQFAYVASHDLQEPLRTVTSYAQILARRYRGQLDTDADDFIGYIVNGADRMQSLIEALLMYSRVIHSPGIAEPAFTKVPLKRSLDAALSGLKKALDDAGGQVESSDLPVVHGDESQLTQLFQNLVGNSLKYHRPGIPPRICISSEAKGSEWIVSVADNGIGFEPRYAKRIFGVFKRLHGRDVPGTGIGLAICQRIVDRHHGRIWAEGKPGEGAIFRFALPAN